MACSNKLGNYSIECDLNKPSDQLAVVTVVENGRELHRRTLTQESDEDAELFTGRIWKHI